MSDFLEKFNKETKKMTGISTEAKDPEFWISSGCKIINRIIAGDYEKCVPQGRLLMLAGSSGAGKSFMAGNMIKSALEQDVVVLLIDSENAIDEAYLRKIGANIDGNPNFVYRGVKTIEQTISIVSKFTKFYRDSGATQKCLIVIDSLDMLRTNSGVDKYAKGNLTNDQGQQVKQLKSMLSDFVQDIKSLPMAMVCTKQVYQEQDPIAAMTNPWRVTPSLQFAFSQILLITKLALKDAKTREMTGITLKAYGFKTRFTKPFQAAKVEVPYDTGMDEYSGILEAAEEMGIVSKSGAWYTFGEKKFQKKNSSDVIKEIYEKLVSVDNPDTVMEISSEEIEIMED